MIRTAALLSLLLVAGAAGTAGAMTIEFADYSAGDGLAMHTFSTGAGDLTLVASGLGTRVLDFDANGVGVLCIEAPCGFWDDAGLVDALDVLTIYFHDGPLFVESLTVTDLHRLEWGTLGGDHISMLFHGNSSGVQTIDVSADTTWLRLTALVWSDYSLHSVDLGLGDKGGVRPIPEPNAALAFPVGGLIVGAAILLRKRRVA